MKSLKVVLFLILFPLVVISQNGWFSQNSNTNGKLTSIFFVNDLTGFAVGWYGVFLKTENGGLNWSANNISSQPLNSIFFVNSYTGFVAGGISNSFGHSRILLRTTDRGLTWTNLLNDGGYPLYSVYFLNIQTGWIGGVGQNIYKTTNSGLIFSQQSLSEAMDIFFFDEMIGFACSQAGAHKSTNGGVNWITMFGNMAAQALHFNNPSTGFVVYYSNVRKTSDGGLNWITQNIWDNKGRSDITFVTSQTGFVVGEKGGGIGYLDKTSNGGINWVEVLTTSAGSSIWSIFFINQNTGWLCGSNGTIMKTTNGGNPTGVVQTSNEIPNYFTLSQNYPNPFNPVTNIKFDIPKSGHIKIAVYDLLGKEVSVLVNEFLKAGVYEADFNAANLPSGVYFYRLNANGFLQTRKMVLLK